MRHTLKNLRRASETVLEIRELDTLMDPASVLRRFEEGCVLIRCGDVESRPCTGKVKVKDTLVKLSDTSDYPDGLPRGRQPYFT